MIKAQSRYSDLFSSQFSKSWSPFSLSGLDLEEFVVDVIIPALLLFCVKKFIDFEFQVSIWNLEFVVVGGYFGISPGMCWDGFFFFFWAGSSF